MDFSKKLLYSQMDHVSNRPFFPHATITSFLFLSYLNSEVVSGPFCLPWCGCLVTWSKHDCLICKGCMSRKLRIESMLCEGKHERRIGVMASNPLSNPNNQEFRVDEL
jgi:hypothetical protein